MGPEDERQLKARYLRTAIREYEYSPAPEYDKTSLTTRAAKEGTVDFDYDSPDSGVDVGIDGAWVNARVWVPKEWLDS